MNLPIQKTTRQVAGSVEMEQRKRFYPDKNFFIIYFSILYNRDV